MAASPRSLLRKAVEEGDVPTASAILCDNPAFEWGTDEYGVERMEWQEVREKERKRERLVFAKRKWGTQTLYMIVTRKRFWLNSNIFFRMYTLPLSLRESHFRHHLLSFLIDFFVHLHFLPLPLSPSPSLPPTSLSLSFPLPLSELPPLCCMAGGFNNSSASSQRWSRSQCPQCKGEKVQVDGDRGWSYEGVWVFSSLLKLFVCSIAIGISPFKSIFEFFTYTSLETKKGVMDSSAWEQEAINILSCLHISSLDILFSSLEGNYKLGVL